ncbi:hypothetical protein OAU99_01610 [Candidatus Poseidoniaceae archaeon]|jgi:uncharacterized phage infection (PIP) family protein YhgE|nr:hypothetical protein [Candidatus Poseidoniaceae archaeon]
MQMINAILIFIAIILMWQTLNLERSAKLAQTSEQSSQLNDSMEFLRKLKTKSPSENSQSQRINAYRKTVEESLKDNPESIDRVELNFDLGSKECANHLNEIANSSNELATKFEQIQIDIEQSKSKEDRYFAETSSHLRDMMLVIKDLESSSIEVENRSRELSNQIAEVKSGVVF